MKALLTVLLGFFFYAADCQTSTPIVAGQTIQLHSSILKEDRTIFIAVPNNYAQTQATFPVLYLLDGETHFMHTASSAAFLSMLGQMPKCIIVSIANTDRARDMTPKPAITDKDFPSGGGADAFLAFIKTELQPYIQDHYRTTHFAILAGTSLSGLFVVNTFTKDPMAFNAYLAASPAMWWDQGALERRAEHTLEKGIEKNRFLYISLCDGDSKVLQANTHRLLNKLKARKADALHYHYSYINGENHNSSPLKSFYTGFEWLYDNWQLESVQSLDVLKKHYQSLSEKYDYPIDIPEEQVNALGYNLLFAGKYNEAIKTFRLNTERYAGSANAWDSMGDAYKLANQLDSAKASYEKGCAIARQTNDVNASSMCNNLAEVIKLIQQRSNK